MNEHIHTPQCKKLLSEVSEFIDGELPEELCSEIEAHLKSCDNCRIVVNTLRKTIEIYEQTLPPAELPGEIRERLFCKLKLEDYLENPKTGS